MPLCWACAESATAVVDCTLLIYHVSHFPLCWLPVQGGAHVAINTLTSSGMVAASLSLLERGTAFVEISKRDIWSAARVAQGESACFENSWS